MGLWRCGSTSRLARWLAMAAIPPLLKNSAGNEVSTNDRAHSTFTLEQNDLSLGGICVKHTRIGWERKYALELVRCGEERGFVCLKGNSFTNKARQAPISCSKNEIK